MPKTTDLLADRRSGSVATAHRARAVPAAGLAAILTAAILLLSACEGVPGEGAPAGAVDASLVPLTDRAELASPGGEGSGEPNLFVADDGRVYLSWFEPVDGDRYALRFSVLDRDGAANGGVPVWNAPRTIVEGDDFFVNWADFPSMFALPDGRLAAHWPRRSGSGTYDYDVEVSWSLDRGASWSEPMIPHRDGTLSEHGFVSFFPLRDGSLGAVWLDGRNYGGWDEEAGAVIEPGRPDDPEMTLRFTSLTPETMGPDVLVDGRVCECCQTSAAVTSEGPLVVYRDRSPEEVRDISVVRYLDGEWTDPAPVYRDGWVIRACPVNGPMVDADGPRVAVAWFTAADERPRVRVAFSDDAGASFDPPVRVDDGSPTGRVATILLPGGDALVTWLERAEDGAEIRIRRVRPDGTMGPSETVALSTTARASGFPRMARSGDRLIFAWTDARAGGGEGREVRTALAVVGEGGTP